MRKNKGEGMNNVHLPEIEFAYNGQKQVITPMLLHDEKDTILVACGYPDFVPLLQAAAMDKGT